MNSIWNDTINLPTFPTLSQDTHTDVLIIGGGITGILCAYLLHESGVDYLLVEGNKICRGITHNTTAKLTSQHGLIYHKLAKKHGIETAKMYLDSNEMALNKYRKLCNFIDCDFESKDSYVYSLTDSDKIRKEVTTLNELGFPAAYEDSLPLPFPVAGAVRFENQAQFNPLKFLAAIAKDLNIREHTFVREIKNSDTSNERFAITDHGTISANRIIVATHFPFINKHGMYFLKIYQHRSYVLALEHAPDINGMYIDESDTGLSFRNYKNLLLLGGGSHRTGKKGGNWTELRNFAHKYFPDAREKYHWATQDCMTLDEIPYIGPYSPNTPGLYVATGFNKWGMTSSMVAAMILRDQILGIENPYESIFSPSRSMLNPKLAMNFFSAITGLLYPSIRRCSHMGCALKWNPAEHTWDCSCHGSRFDESGNLIDNPAMKNPDYFS